MQSLGHLKIKFISSAFACTTFALLLAGCESADEKVNRIISETKGKFDKLESSPKTGKSAEEYGTILAALDDIVKTYPQTNAAVAISAGSGFGGLSRDLVQGRIRSARTDACAQNITTRCLVELVADPGNGFTGKGGAWIDALAAAYNGNANLDEFLADKTNAVWDIRAFVLALGAAGKVDTALQISKLFSDRRVQPDPQEPAKLAEAQAYLDRVLPGVLRCTAEGTPEQCKKLSASEQNIGDSIMAAYARIGVSPSLAEFVSLNVTPQERALYALTSFLTNDDYSWRGTNTGEATTNMLLPASAYPVVDGMVDKSLDEAKGAKDHVIDEVFGIQFWSKHRRGASVDDVFQLFKDRKGSSLTLAYGCNIARRLGGERTLAAYVELSRKLYKHNPKMIFNESWEQFSDSCLPIEQMVIGAVGAAGQGGNVKPFITLLHVILSHSRHFATLTLQHREAIVSAIDNKMKATLTAKINLPIDEAHTLLQLRGAASGRVETTPAYPLTRADLHQRWQQAQTVGALRGTLARQDYKAADHLLAQIPELERYRLGGLEARLLDFVGRNTPKAALYLSDKKFAALAIDEFMSNNTRWPLSAQGY